MTNTATVQSATADPTTSNNTDTAASTVSTRADIAVTKTVDPVDGVAGAPMTFTITVRNNGPSVGRDVHLDDTVTVDFDFGTLPAACEVVAGQLQCDLGDLDPGTTRVVTISGAPASSADAGSYSNSVVASTSTTDPVNANDSARADFTLRTESDAAISKTGDATLTAGDAFSYQVTATTAGPPTPVTSPSPTRCRLVFGSVTTAQGTCAVAGQTITCQLGTIPAPDGSVLITITRQVRPDATGTVTNTATLTASTTDPDPGNNTSIATSNLVSSADLAVDKTPDNSPLIAGATVGYTLTVTNQGPSDAAGVQLTDALPVAIAFDPASSDPACTLTAGSHLQHNHRPATPPPPSHPVGRWRSPGSTCAPTCCSLPCCSPRESRCCRSAGTAASRSEKLDGMTEARTVRAPRGTAITARGWQTEAPLRMLQNNLDPEVAEHPEQLVVYGGTGKAARDWPSYDAIVRTLTDLKLDETLLVQSGRPVGVLRTHEWAPRVLIANSNLVGDWANWEEFRRLEALGLIMYGQMTAGSWIYIGTQGILQGTYETFAAVAAKLAAAKGGGPEQGGGTLAGTITLTAGLGGMGGAQPLAVTMNDGVAICVECDPSRIARRIEHRYLDVQAADVDEALRLAVEARDARKPLSIGLLGNAATLVPQLLANDAPIDIVTDQTSAHDPLSYLPIGVEFDDWHEYAARKPEEFTGRARASMARHVEAMVGFLDRGAEVFDYGNSIRGEAQIAGYTRAFALPGFVPAYIRPLFCEGKGPFRWVALSGDPADIARTDQAVLELFPDNDSLRRWITMAQERVQFQGLPARICWLGYGERDRAGLAFNSLVSSGELRAPIVIGRDHLDAGSVASPYRETEAMLDGSDAIADWPLLNAMVNVASGASWVSIHHGGGVGMGRSIHAGQVTVADGTPLAAQKLERVLTNDPGMGVIRHVDAGYDRAVEVASERGVGIPMR